jgi:aryl-alcohol dehydrogenase-like predicted oxidoreductase
MKNRTFGRTAQQVSEIGFGAWAIGGAWGDVTSTDAKAALHAALDQGVTFLDTADVYGDGRSEQFIAEVLSERGGPKPLVATKIGRRLSPHVAEGYTQENLTAFVERSLRNLQTDSLDLVQLHCPPPAVYYQPEVFEAMDRLVTSGKVRAYGVSVEKVEEGLKAIEYPNVQSVQIIFNIFRQRPAELFFAEARRRKVGVIARVPLASGLLTGKMSATTPFAQDDHRSFNRNGEAFDKGETFSGVPYDLALQVTEDIRRLVPEGMTMAQFALRWILMESAVSTVIPGAKNALQAQANGHASSFPDIPAHTMEALRQIYLTKIFPSVHHRW